MRLTRGSSALRMATPPSDAGGSDSTSSAFASSIASREPIRDRWTGWTAVTIPIDGCPIAASSRISPPVYMPISRTAASCPGPRSSTVSGIPTSLFRLPSVRSVANRRSRTPATASFVDVLAMLPVTPMTSGEKRRRHAAAVAWRPRSVSGTRTTVTSPRSSRAGSPASGRRLTRSADAPPATACARYRWPSVRSPASATNRPSRATSRESTAPPRIGRSLRLRSRPPVAPTRSSAVIDGAGSTAPAGRAGEPGIGDRPGSVTASSVAQATVTGSSSWTSSGASGPRG